MDIERITAARNAATVSRGRNMGHLKAKCPPTGTDAAVYWQAVQWVKNPFRVGIGHILYIDYTGQKGFFDECVKWVEQ